MATEEINLLRRFLVKEGFETKEFSESTRTSAEAAKEIGCSVSQIAKSLIFRGEETGEPILVIASGSNKVNEKKVEKEAGEKIAKADAEFVKRETGFSIGSVPPIIQGRKIKTFIDRDLKKQKTIWAAAGTGNSVFSLTPEQLANITKGKAIDIS